MVRNVSASAAAESAKVQSKTSEHTLHSRAKISGRIICVTHQIPYTCVFSQAGRLKAETTPPATPPEHADHYLNSNLSQWTLAPRRGHSAVYAGLRSLAAKYQTIFVGWTGDVHTEDGTQIDASTLPASSQDALKEALARTPEKVVPVLLNLRESAGHYEGYCKKVLWPLFHYILWDSVTDGRVEKENWNDYIQVNKHYVDVVEKIYQPGDIIWIQDYHLLLAPQMLRERIYDSYVGLFFHAPFPSSEIFRCLPKRREILEGMLGANQIGFQTYAYARHFISACTRALGHESTPKGIDAGGAQVNVGTFPIGIDVDRIELDCKLPGVLSKIQTIRDMYAGKKIIVGRDKLDLVKGVLQKLQAFEKFLIEYPEWRNKVVLIQVTSPALSESQKLERKISDLAAHINGTYGSLNFTPVHHFHQTIDRDEYFALLSVADMALITSVRDGMNTTSLEYVVCQQEGHGPLILSEFTGTAGSLSAAMLVNPWDSLGVAKALNEALLMSDEHKRMRHAQLYDHVKSHTAQFWAQSFVTELLANIATPDQSDVTAFLDTDMMMAKYVEAEKRLLLFDYDGTLTPIVKTPSAAIPTKKMLTYLNAIAEDRNNIVWVISGRDQNVLEEWLGGIKRLGLSAEHGCFMRPPESDKWINLTEEFDMSWKNDVIEIFSYYTERTQGEYNLSCNFNLILGSFIEHKRCSVTWHYRMADPEYGAFQAKECQNHLENAVLSKLPVEILIGKKNIEVRPMAVNKGEIVKRLVQMHAVRPEESSRPSSVMDGHAGDETWKPLGFIFCAGDDKTDEDMFRALRKSSHGTTSLATSPPTSSHGRNEDASIPTPSSPAAPTPGLITPDINFSTTLGPATKKTMAEWHVSSPEDIIRIIGQMAQSNEAVWEEHKHAIQ